MTVGLKMVGGPAVPAGIKYRDEIDYPSDKGAESETPIGS